ncbi:MAG: zinc-ribbon domain-containing protein [Oscillospiraceae bacterium]|jgi:hypothetical protein|nr:zinc-ribbon domain-containing protein [Oscillospiraceae bacterium]
MLCTICGKQNQDDAVFCSSCGAKIGTQNSYQWQQGNNQAFTAAASITLNSMPPATLNPADIAMFKVKKTGIAVEMDGVWGEKTFIYLNPQEMYEDCNAMFAALQQITKGMVVQLKSEGGPVVPIYRINKVYANDWWKRLEIDIEGAGRQWFQYPDKNALNADYTTLMNQMRSGQQQ